MNFEIYFSFWIINFVTHAHNYLASQFISICLVMLSQSQFLFKSLLSDRLTRSESYTNSGNSTRHSDWVEMKLALIFFQISTKWQDAISFFQISTKWQDAARRNSFKFQPNGKMQFPRLSHYYDGTTKNVTKKSWRNIWFIRNNL